MRLICIQARMSSSRLPGKVMLPLAGAPLLQRMVERVQAAEVDAKTVVLTSQEHEDDTVEQLCSHIGVDVFRGHLTDLLDRHYQAAQRYGASVVAKIPSDCPLVDVQVIEDVFAAFDRGDHDYVSNLHPATYPDGNDVEVFSIDALEQAWREASKDFEREHTTPFIWERPKRFKIGNVTWESRKNYSMSHRWTIDYSDDYDFIRTIYERLWTEARPIFAMKDILDLLERKPELCKINEKYLGVNWYRNHLSSLKTIVPSQTRQLEEDLA